MDAERPQSTFEIPSATTACPARPRSWLLPLRRRPRRSLLELLRRSAVGRTQTTSADAGRARRRPAVSSSTMNQSSAVSATGTTVSAFQTTPLWRMRSCRCRRSRASGRQDARRGRPRSRAIRGCGVRLRDVPASASASWAARSRASTSSGVPSRAWLSALSPSCPAGSCVPRARGGPARFRRARRSHPVGAYPGTA